MKTEVKTITPKMAGEMLKGNRRNRNVSTTHVNRLAAAILAGEWKLNGDAIRFNGNDLIDGQHRLNAIIKAGKAVKTLVITELDSDVFDSIDIGKVRSSANTLETIGEKNCNVLAAALRNLRNILAGKVMFGESITNVEIMKGLAEHPELRSSCSRIINMKVVKGLLPSGWATALHYLFSRKDETMAELFFHALETGSNLTSTDPIHLLRNRLIGNKTGATRLPPVHLAAITIKAWNGAVKGEKMKVLRWANGEDFPLIEK